jgi:crossover junction endodeoxyribonuclease RusA
LIRGSDGKPKAVANMREQDPNLAAWRHEVAQMGRLMLPTDWDVNGFFVLDTFFFMPRPRAHFDSAGKIKKSASHFHCSQKDCDKMLRAIGDALTGVCYEDDDRIALATAAKLYHTESQPSGVWVSVGQINTEALEREIPLLLP